MSQLYLAPVTSAARWHVGATLEEVLPLTPITFAFGLEPKTLIQLEEGNIPSVPKGTGWSVSALKEALPEGGSRAAERSQLLKLYWDRYLPEATRDRIVKLYHQPSLDELTFEYNFDPRVDRGELYFQDGYGDYKILSPPQDTISYNGVLSETIGTHWRLVPPQLWRDWLKPERWFEPAGQLDPRFVKLVKALGLTPRLEDIPPDAISSLRAPLPLKFAMMPNLHLTLEELEELGPVMTHQIYSPIFPDNYPAILDSLAHLDHPNLIKFHGAWQGTDLNLNLVTQPWLPIQQKIDLNVLEVEARAQPPLAQRLQWSLELATGLAELHRRGMVHNQLDPGQVGLAGGQCKLLYLAPSQIKSKVDIYQESNLTQMPYRSPSVYDARQELYTNDVNALGFIIYYIVTGLPAYHKQGNQGWILRKILAGEWPVLEGVVPDKLAQLLPQMWVIVPELKVTAKEVVAALRRMLSPPS